MQVRNVIMSGCTVQLRIEEGRPGKHIVFVHGVGASGRYWLPLAKHLPQHNLFLPDLPGYGSSERVTPAYKLADYADFIHRLLQELQLDDVVLVGNSYGCQIVLEYLQRHGQDKVNRAVLIGPTVCAAERHMPTQVMRVVQDIPRESLRTLAILTWDYLHASPRQFFCSLKDAVNDTPENKLPAVLIPTLVIRGQKDRLTPQAWAETVTKSLPQGELAVIPRSSHVTHSTSHRATAAVIREFIAGN